MIELLPDKEQVRPSDAAILVTKAKRLQAEGDATSWQLADTYVELKQKHGWSDRQIAEECGVSRQHVQRFRSCAERLPTSEQRPSFWEAFQEVTGKGEPKPEAEAELEPESEILKRILVPQPRVELSFERSAVVIPVPEPPLRLQFKLPLPPSKKIKEANFLDGWEQRLRIVEEEVQDALQGSDYYTATKAVRTRLWKTIVVKMIRELNKLKP